MENRNIAVMSVLITLVALIILILSLAFVIMSQPATRAKIENMINPLTVDNYDDTPIIKIRDIIDKDDDDDDDDEDPVISGLPDMTLAFGEIRTLDLDSYASDDEDSHSDLTFTIIYTPTVSPDPITITIDTTTHVLTITESNGAWEGTQAVTIEVEDTDGNKDEDSFTVTIDNGTGPAPNSPVISGLPDVTFSENGAHTIDLNNYVSDPDNTDAELTWTYTGNTNVLININSNNVATFTATSNWNGQETVIFRVEDPDGNWDEDTIIVTVIDITNAPTISGLPDVEFDEDDTSEDLELDDYVSDPDNLDSELTWTFYGNSNIIVTIDLANEVTFSAPANWNGDEDITFRVEDPDGNWDEETINVEVNPVDDPTIWQSLSDQTIDEDSPIGTVVYANIISRVTDVDGPVTINIASSNTHFTVNMNGNNLVLSNLNANWYGSETIILEANGQTANFQLNVNQLMDDCVTKWMYTEYVTYCD